MGLINSFGAVGPQGPKGDTGATGATGPQGPAGSGSPLIYSTSERNVGTWVDGKTLYQKTLIDTMPEFTESGGGTNLTTPSEKFINIGVSVDKIISIEAVRRISAGGYSPFALAPSTNYWAGRSLTISGDTGISLYGVWYDIFNNSHPTNPNKIRLRSTNRAASGVEVIITIRYTKV